MKIDLKELKKLLSFYRQMLISWSQYLPASEAPSQVLFQFLWCNNYINNIDRLKYGIEIISSYLSYLKMAASSQFLILQ